MVMMAGYVVFSPRCAVDVGRNRGSCAVVAGGMPRKAGNCVLCSVLMFAATAGVAEMFMEDPERERIKVMSRRGFIRVRSWQLFRPVVRAVAQV